MSVRVTVLLMQAYSSKGEMRPTPEPADWEQVPRLGDGFVDEARDIDGVVHSVTWYGPTAAVLHIKEHAVR